MNYYIDFWKNTFSFRGRLSRRGYFIPLLINEALLYIPAMIIAGLPGIDPAIQNEVSMGLYVSVLALGTIPTTSSTARRLHDAGLPGGEMFVAIIPVIGIIKLA